MLLVPALPGPPTQLGNRKLVWESAVAFPSGRRSSCRVWGNLFPIMTPDDDSG